MTVISKSKKIRKYRNPRRKRIFVIFLLLLLAGTVFDLWISRYGLETTSYTITTDITDEISAPFRIVQLTDLHNSVFGKDNERLIRKVAEAEPDLILITGDLVNSKAEPDTSIATSVITALSAIAPVYVSYGNQEKEMESEYGIDFTTLYTQAGAIVVERSYVDTEINGTPVRIGGIYGYCQPELFAEISKRADENAFLEAFQNTDRYKILLCHMPVCWLCSGSLYDWNVDVVFSGHAHGGQVRIPFVGGLWAPDQGWFPGQECGVYDTSEEGYQQFLKSMINWADYNGYDASAYEDRDVTDYHPGYLILSRGLGNTDWLPRFNNVPEVLVVEFQ